MIKGGSFGLFLAFRRVLWIGFALTMLRRRMIAGRDDKPVRRILFWTEMLGPPTFLPVFLFPGFLSVLVGWSLVLAIVAVVDGIFTRRRDSFWSSNPMSIEPITRFRRLGACG